jgi:hypothetical protein
VGGFASALAHAIAFQLIGRLVREHSMLDAVVLVLGLVFFAATIAYAYACDRL